MNTRFSYLSLAVAGAVVALPGAAAAQNFLQTLSVINTAINALIPILISLAIVLFFWGVIRYIVNLGDEGKRQEAIQLMIWGVIAIFVMVSIWGLIRLLQGTFQVTGNQPIVPAGIQLRPN